MTEAQWYDADDPQGMLDWLRQQGMLSERKVRLFSVAVCRRLSSLLVDGRSRKAVEVAERFADGLDDEDRVAVAGEAAYRASGSPRLRNCYAHKYAAWAVSAAAQAPTTPFEVADETSFHAAD